MKLSNMFEQDPAMAAAMGANALKKTMGANTSGAMVSKALGKLDQGAVLSPNLAKALGPYAEALEKILSNPQYRNKFMQMMKQMQAADKKQHQSTQEPATNSIKLTPGWGDGGKSMKANYGKLAGQAESVNEDQDSVDAVAGAVTRRIMSQHMDVLSKYGPVKVIAAIDDVAEFAGGDGLEEIGSSDVSIWTKQVIQDLESGHFDHVESVREAEEDVVDTVTMDVPLLLRMMEYAREDAQEDMDLHDVAERMIAMSKDGPLSMDDYENIVGSVEALPAPEDVEESVDSIVSKQEKAQAIYDYIMELPRDDMMDMGISIGDDGVEEAIDSWIDSLDDAEFEEMYQYTLEYNDDDDINEYRKLAGLAPVEEGYYAPGPETMPGAVGPQETTTVSFNQSKQMGDATLNINASAKDMEELHRILKLAGIDYDSSGEVEEPHAPEAPAEEPCGCEDEKPADVKYSTDKQTLINVLRDKLQKRLA